MQEPTFEIKKEKGDDRYGKFTLSPLLDGYGDTLGTALRRVLLSSLPGAVITSVKITGVKHQFSTLKGMKEDVLDFLLNLKKVRFTYDGDKPVKVSLAATGPGEVKAGDIEVPAGAIIANPELVLANLSKDSKLNASMEVESGFGYSLAEERKNDTLGSIPLDANFSPIKRVNYKVEETRVGRVTNYDKLNMEIWTDGTISPHDSLLKASSILVGYFNQIVNPKKIEKVEQDASEDTFGAVGTLSVEEIGLPTRVANALAKAGFDTVARLAEAEHAELVKVRNLGEKSVDIIKAALADKEVEMKNA